ncbi:ubiquitin-conjugating enzyme E2 variant 3 [Corythoichthys intestinalis]|uniref:ubiquitin-conjugating enzyme E2 variant 3 n=1 Tax=Corythoichthys intestinalis TaxID=161448 RepID=UPI0025A587F9|nr:ubiquitin-conjugating enzyme E2 variant 3 [Corythoichthys intestinalis]XP_061813376.1 ubiquitin-conjugating enzyme E2 variant 3-like [Nerophis lumbriciformis]
MDLRSDKIQRVLSKYKFHDVALEELDKIENAFPGMIPSVGTYTFSDGSQKELLKLNGNLPVKYEGRSYNFPIQLWLMDSFPVTPPICLLRPTSDMAVREGKHVDARGRIYLPILHNWDHPMSSVVELLEEMISKFQEDPPLSSTSSAQKDPQELLAFVNDLRIGDSSVRKQQQQKQQPLRKVSVIGGGDLGMAVVMSILAKCQVDRLVFIDVAGSSTKGGSADLEIFKPPNVEVSQDLSASTGSQVLVLTAYAWSGDQSYVRVVQTNVDLYRGIVPVLARLNPGAVMLIASHPVDVMTHVAWRQSGLPPSQVIGAGCNLDSERLAHVLRIDLNARQQAWVIGECSENKVPVMSKTEIPGSNVDSTKPLLSRAFGLTKNGGQRSWSVGLSLADITNSILTDRKKVHSVTTLAQGWGGVGAEVFFSLPCLLGSGGSTRLAGVSLGEEEDAKLRESVASLVNLLSQLRI